MNLNLALIVSSIALFSGAGCSGKAQGDSSEASRASTSEVKGQFFNAKIVGWSVGPEVSGDSLQDIRNACEIEITTPSGEVPSSLSVQKVFPFMKVHGHGAPDEQIVTEVVGNRIKVSKISFIMSGPWELHVQATVNGQSGEVEIPVVVP
ncbi:MAG: hypothetical protein ACO3A4_09625 [Silvanigrellaceae bacterium]|jgi:hypothetical protein